MECILILGMHRSGTSCLSGILQKSGVELGEVHTQNPHNKKGNRENQKVVDLNEAVLNENFCTWDEPGVISVWTEQQRQTRSLIIDEIKKDANLFFGFKDSRTVLSLPFWIEVLNPVYIATFRHPLRVAQSLYDREHMPLLKGIELWYQYNLRIYKLISKNRSPLVNFDLNDEAYPADVKIKIKQLGLKSSLVNEAITFFDSELRSQIDLDVTTYKLPDKVENLYCKLQDYHAKN
jgi:hypothetical protein